MADELRQQFTLDAAQALQTLDQLDQSFQRLAATINNFNAAGFNRAGRSVNSTVNALDGAFSRFSDAANQGVTATGNVANSLGRVSAPATAANSSVIRLHTSLSLLSRIVFTQAVIRGLRLIEQGAAAAARQFGDFQKVLSEIRAISPGDSLTDLARSSQELSNAFNVPLLDVARSRYDLISNGFTKAAEQQAVFTAGAKLGKLGVADQAQSVNILSTALNAYGESAQQADKFARLFFQAANVGKFTIAELSSNLGKAAPAAKSLGVSMEDLLGLFSSLTVKGVSTPEAATQINSIFAAFIKPNEAMTEAMRNLGAASGEELIRVRGFAGALQAVVAQTDGSSAGLAKLFPNVRALRGVLTESNDRFATLAAHVKSFRDLTQEEFDLRLFDRLNTDSERAGNAINKLKNAVTLGLGGGLIETAAKLDRMTGKVDVLATTTEKFFRVLTGHGLEDAGEAFDNFASRDIQAVHDQLFKQLQEMDKFRNQVLDKARANPTSLPLDLKSVDDLARVMDSAFDLQKVQAYETEVAKIIEHLRATSRAREGANPALAEQFNAQVDALERISRQAKVTDDDLRPILQGFQDIENKATGVNARLSFAPELKNAAKAMEDLLEKRALLEKVNSSVSPDDLSKVQSAFQSLQSATVSSSQSVNSALVNGANAIEQAGRSAATAIQQAAAAAAAASGGGQGKAFGGPIGFAEGGLVPWQYLAAGGKGTDTVAAMLTPGEFVINAKSAGKFFPQLQAINAGIAPSFPSQTVNHTGIAGDVNINVRGGTAEQTARTIADRLRREMRRGTSRL